MSVLSKSLAASSDVEAWLRVAEEKSKLANLRAIAADHVNFVNTVLRCGVHGTGHGLPPAQRSPLLKLRGDNKTEARLRIAEYLGVQVKEVDSVPHLPVLESLIVTPWHTSSARRHRPAWSQSARSTPVGEGALCRRPRSPCTVFACGRTQSTHTAVRCTQDL